MQEQRRDARDLALVERIRVAMTAAQINMTELATRAGIPYATMRAYLSGDRPATAMSARIIPGLAEALDVEAGWLLTGRPTAPHPRSLMIAVDALDRTIRAWPADSPRDLAGLMSQFYLSYRREYLNRFRDPKNVYVSNSDAQADIAVLKRFRDIAGAQ